MANWYRAGTVALTNGSAAVVGTGTDFVANARTGMALILLDGRVAGEVEAVQDATHLTLAAPWTGGTAGGISYALQPVGIPSSVVTGVADLLASFGAVRDGVGAGLFPDGTVAAPGFRFAADQDTGIRRRGPNAAALVSEGADRIVWDRAGVRVLPAANPTTFADAAQFSAGEVSDNQLYRIRLGYYLDGGSVWRGVLRATAGEVETSLTINPAGGDVLLGVPSANFGAHQVGKPGPESTVQLVVFNGVGTLTAAFYSTGAGGYNGAATAMVMGKNTTTGRSINASGTVNAGGADYAEYMTKAEGCGVIAKGAVCGVDAAGRLTRRWADAVAFVVKSTDPAYVGGDRWDRHLPPRPKAPAPLADEPVTTAGGGDAAAYAAWMVERDRHAAAVQAYEAALPAWQEAHDAAGATVDRIAFSGQVPVIVDGAFAPGDYLIAAANGAGIRAIAVAEADISFDQYRRRLGRVWAVTDDDPDGWWPAGRAWLDVQHG